MHVHVASSDRIQALCMVWHDHLLKEYAFAPSTPKKITMVRSALCKPDRVQVSIGRDRVRKSEEQLTAIDNAVTMSAWAIPKQTS